MRIPVIGCGADALVSKAEARDARDDTTVTGRVGRPPVRRRMTFEGLYTPHGVARGRRVRGRGDPTRSACEVRGMAGV